MRGFGLKRSFRVVFLCHLNSERADASPGRMMHVSLASLRSELSSLKLTWFVSFDSRAWMASTSFDIDIWTSLDMTGLLLDACAWSNFMASPSGCNCGGCTSFSSSTGASFAPTVAETSVSTSLAASSASSSSMLRTPSPSATTSCVTVA
ncbi:hypothetical protein ISCGN_030305 [Ixodes scapularis]